MAVAKNNNNNTELTEWNISTDIYDIVKSVENVKRRYIEDEDETTLALGIYGFLGDTEAKKIQTATIMTGELGNEMFSTRSKLTKNVLSHAIYNNITDINAVPSRMTINIGIKVDDLNTYMRNNRFIFDAECPIFMGNYEFHFDYDIVLNRSALNPNMYSAHYDMTEPNRLSNIINPYLKQPFVIRLGNFDYVIFQALVRQVTIEKTLDKIISASIIENKTYTFDFDNQIADFDVYVTDNGKTTRLTPLLYGSSSEDIEKYCWYLYISDNTIRISFDRKSFIPGLNSDIEIKAYTTLGSKGIFSYKKIDGNAAEGIYIDIESAKYNYSKITCYMVAITNSVNGTDRKTKEELQKLIPKAALARGAITTEKDIENYFNLIDTEVNRLVMQKKVDNQLSRIWYGYFVLKDENNNIIPTNTVMIEMNTNEDGIMYKAEDGRFVLPAGTIIHYDMKDRIGRIVDESDTPDIYSKEYFDNKNYYYMTVYNIILNPDPLYAAFHLAITDKDSYFSFEWVNEASNLQFVANKCNFQRNLLTDQSTYKFTFKIAQAISGDFGMYYEEDIEEETPDGEIITKTIVTNNMKCIMVLFRSGAPYRWIEAELTDYNFENYISSWQVKLDTDNGMDNENRIKIRDLRVIGKENEINYGYFDSHTQAQLYILAKFEEGTYGRYNLDDIAPGFKEYSVTNVYEVEDGFDFYENFTNILDTRVYAIDDMDGYFRISGVPVVGLHYMTDEFQADYLVDAIAERRAYIDYCLVLLENSMKVDFKFFNTYGPSVTYTIGNKENTMIGHVDLCFKFRVSMKDISDVYTKDDIIKDIKAYVEDLYNTGNLHVPNLITDLSNKFRNRCNFIEFMNFNDFRLGIQHIIKLDVDDPHTVPEFLNIRNRYNEDEDKLEPCIDIEILY